MSALDNIILQFLGNIRVFVRARPIISEDGKNAKEAVSYDLSDDAIIYVNNTQKGRSQTFEVDRVFPGSASQEQVCAYKVASFLKGFDQFCHNLLWRYSFWHRYTLKFKR